MAIYLFVLASDFSEKWTPLFGSMLELAKTQACIAQADANWPSLPP
ncbi:hypothetical protein [Bosea sp. (in: a-proteobacteria)]